MKNLYALLGIGSDASFAEVKAAYRKKASRYHPDKNASVDAPAKFREIQDAYETLSDPILRKAHDANRRKSLLEDPVQTAGEIWSTYLEGVLKP